MSGGVYPRILTVGVSSDSLILRSWLWCGSSSLELMRTAAASGQIFQLKSRETSSQPTSWRHQRGYQSTDAFFKPLPERSLNPCRYRRPFWNIRRSLNRDHSDQYHSKRLNSFYLNWLMNLAMSWFIVKHPAFWRSGFRSEIGNAQQSTESSLKSVNFQLRS